MKKGFTLLELVVVIVIIGVLATLGLVQYTQVVEKGKRVEAKSVLGMLRMLEIAYSQEKGGSTYATLGTGTNQINTGVPTASCDTAYHFQYSCSGTTGTCTATRCTSGGKSDGATAYTITLTTGGVIAEP
ncbi:MAG: prepilin-type N-terminal cleavage/methylation domain-containing protein [Candidatus Omnitrophota bacterium]|jgi:type IV pilus assembly protein PilE